MIKNISLFNQNKQPSFKAGKLEVKQQTYGTLAKELEIMLKRHVENMPDGDTIITTIEPTGFLLRTKYIPGPNAPKGSDKITLLTRRNSPPAFSIRSTDSFVEEMSSELSKPDGFSIKRFLSKTSLLIGETFDRLFTKKNGEVIYDQLDDAYIINKNSPNPEKIFPD